MESLQGMSLNNLDQIKQAINDFYQEKDESSNEDFAQEENLQVERPCHLRILIQSTILLI